MNAILKNYRYLNKFFPADFIESVAEDTFLYRLLVDKDPRANLWRQEIDDCLELACRYDLVDADLEGRLRKGDWEMWEAAINELRVAKRIEELFGINCLNWHPQGRERKVGEFEILSSSFNVPIFVEVKTILPRDLENLEQRVYDKLRNCVKEVRLPFIITIRLKSAGETENFSCKLLKSFLSQELSKLSITKVGESYKLPDYQDKTGLQIAEINAYPNPKRKYCYIGLCSFNARAMRGADYIKHSLNKGYIKLKGTQPSLIILCPSPNHLIDEHDMLDAWLGTETFVINFGGDGKIKDTKTTRKPDGFFKDKPKLSACGIYREQVGKEREEIRGGLELYHNPLASDLLDKSIFRGGGVRQLVRKNDQEMEWIE